MTGFNLLHRFGIAMVVRERFVHFANIESISIGDMVWAVPSLFDERMELSNRYATLRNVGLVMNGRLVCGDDSVLRHCHRLWYVCR
ncbi:hypothetical protein C463_17333 [Halorubrum californiense DSM 19288]|uniref:Uncharacterized protein n=1 Tax=Halorubrum californiense DSM 19288 TaxID=1227465 RepID=M0DYM4_9EURY|nr:hypothetical protein C463_17333 [Halorubrum californiense DSM 19288]